MSPRTSTSSSQPRFKLGFAWESPSPAQLATSHIALSSGRVTPGKTQVGIDLGLHLPGNPRSIRQLQTTLENHYTASAQLIYHRGHRVVVIGHTQSLQLTGLGKSLPLICQQQPRLNYNRKVYSVHRKGTPQVPSLGDRGGCATGPFRTPTTLGHTTKTQNQSSST